MPRRIISLLLCVFMLSGLAGCTDAPKETTPPAVTTAPASEPTAADLYAQARLAVDEAVNLKLYLTTDRVMTVGSECFTSTTSQDLSITGIGTDDIQVKLLEELDLNGQFQKTTEYFTNGTLYISSTGTLAKGELGAAEYLARFAPAVLLDAALYGDIQATVEEGGTRITFVSPSGPESWAMPDGAQMVSAGGSALISPEGVLKETVYSIVYDHGAAHIALTVTAVPEVRQAIPIVGINAPSQYHAVSNILVPELYNMAQLYLCAANSVSSTATETVLCEAVDLGYMHQLTLDLYGQDEDFMAHMAYQLAVYQGADSWGYTLDERYEDGTYTFTDADGTVTTASYPSDYVSPTFRNYLTENIPPLDYVTSIDIAEMGGIIYLEMGCSEEYCNSLNNYACQRIFGSAGFLNGSASSYETLECIAYLAIDSYTGFPTAVGVYYNGLHTIEGREYILSLQIDQSFYVASQDAYELLTGESLPAQEPAVSPTPLFYHVTGGEGQEMWLMGTIHVGDERTACLPQEIYGALEGSDALAVEFDVSAFEEALAADEDLAETIYNAYFYEDGTLTYEHLDEDAYAAGLMMLRASGSYGNAFQYMKPAVWSQAIDGLFLQQSYALRTSQGVDLQLMDKAKELGKTILDIESGASQIQLLYGYSDELQQLLLLSSLSMDIASYRESLIEQYEAWCAGEEAVLRESVSTDIDLSALAEEELAMYEAALPYLEEYKKAMYFDRNEAMLQTAIEYLESGDTIFYAVGLAHLLDGTNGLVDALREAGYTVEQVEYTK